MNQSQSPISAEARAAFRAWGRVGGRSKSRKKRDAARKNAEKAAAARRRKCV